MNIDVTVQDQSLEPCDTSNAAKKFLDRLPSRYSVERAILFGSRARGTFHNDSDADIAIVLSRPVLRRNDAALEMAGIAFDVMLETGVLIEALPLWQEELNHPEKFGNPLLIEAILRDGIDLSI